MCFRASVLSIFCTFRVLARLRMFVGRAFLPRQPLVQTCFIFLSPSLQQQQKTPPKQRLLISVLVEKKKKRQVAMGWCKRA